MFNIFDFIFNMNTYLPKLINAYGTQIYLILFIVIFIETGLVVFPFLPGDTLLFVVGTLAASNKSLNIVFLIFLLSLAAILGDSVNFEIGKRFGKRAENKDSRFINHDKLEETHQFFKKYGMSAIILGRFVPFVRTLIPFVAGSGNMNYRKFISYNVLGGIFWVSFKMLTGYFLGNVPIVRDHLDKIMIVVLSLTFIVFVVSAIYRNNKKTRGK